MVKIIHINVVQPWSTDPLSDWKLEMLYILLDQNNKKDFLTQTKKNVVVVYELDTLSRAHASTL